MKNLFTLKSLAALLLLCISLTSCKDKKEDDPAPQDLATRSLGTYVFSELEFDGKKIPAEKSDLKGDIRIVKKTPTSVDVELDIRSKSSGDEFMVLDASDIQLIENGSSIDLVYDNEKVGTINGKKITVNGTDAEGIDFKLSATR
ncbi:hypothetical protein [Dyadobacter luticola]|uniref:Lipocalin-like domain-containing protein n=1 Tax=Dyadobacter luticola TaxID=1979387 RepID=A0A5R9L4S2_9BACT|nr:hypothetical protein [Dyadobacter luticola]TLV03418.1 hypothetical protein FEN17_07375 [Dyadobacter luticola]